MSMIEHDLRSQLICNGLEIVGDISLRAYHVGMTESSMIRHLLDLASMLGK